MNKRLNPSTGIPIDSRFERVDYLSLTFVRRQYDVLTENLKRVREQADRPPERWVLGRGGVGHVPARGSHHDGR